MDKQTILRLLNNQIKGHDIAKKEVMSVFERSRVRHYQRNMLEYTTTNPSLISNKSILLVGKSGTGKTYLVEQTAKLYKMPVMTIDATSLTLTSAHDGMKLDDLLKKIKAFATAYVLTHPRDFHSVQGVLNQMVVFIDEFDKLSSRHDKEGWYNRVQSNFLRLFEGKCEGFEDVSFIFAGAFMSSGIYETESIKNTIGFFNQNDDTPSRSDLESSVIKAGIIPEIVGRIDSIVELDVLSKQDYLDILNDLVIPQKNEQLLALTGDSLHITDEQRDSIVDMCYNSDQGVRYLYKQIDKLSLSIEHASDKYDFIRL